MPKSILSARLTLPGEREGPASLTWLQIWLVLLLKISIYVKDCSLPLLNAKYVVPFSVVIANAPRLLVKNQFCFCFV